jgi:NADPH:quinone reductase-like Zn-dependent oxidoreductase
MQKGERIMVHTGWSSIGQAAITLALDSDCTVFTTVANQQQRAFIKHRFPEVSAKCNKIIEANFGRYPTSNTN